MQRAFLAGIFLSIISSIMGIYLLLRGISFMGAGISHAAFGGLAIGYLLGINTTITGIIFTLLMIWTMPYIVKKAGLKQDVPISIYFSSSMALGALLLSLHKGYTVDLFSFLFGNILAINEVDLIITFIFSIFLIIFFVKNYWKIIYLIFDQTSAEISGINTFKLEEFILTLTGIAIVLISKLVGVILSSALLIIPTATLLPFVKDFKKLILLNIFLNIFSIFSGLILSYYFNLPAGSTTVLVLTVVFFFSFLIKKS